MSIRKVVKDVMVNTFFEEENFRKFMEQTDAKNLMRLMDINKKVEDAVNSPAATAAIDAKFKEISSGEMFDPSRVVEPEMMIMHMDEMLEERLITLDAET